MSRATVFLTTITLFILRELSSGGPCRRTHGPQERTLFDVKSRPKVLRYRCTGHKAGADPEPSSTTQYPLGEQMAVGVPGPVPRSKGTEPGL